MSKNITRGKIGEEMAVKFMEEQGYTIVARNYRSGRAEIDIILKKDNILIFAEVKFRTNVSHGMPEEAVNDKKATLIIEAAENFILDQDWKGDVRFDIISIRGKKEIFHFEDAFS